MSLISFTRNLEAKHLPEQCAEVIAILSRIADALERLAGPMPTARGTVQYKADLKDLIQPESETADAINHELELFANNANVQIDSEAFIKSIIEYEKQVMDVYGKDAILELPWNKAAGGSLFQADAGQRDAQPQGARRTADREPPPGGPQEEGQAGGDAVNEAE